MSAARGIIHEERPQQDQGLMFGYQLWVNLPSAQKMSEPFTTTSKPIAFRCVHSQMAAQCA